MAFRKTLDKDDMNLAGGSGTQSLEGDGEQNTIAEYQIPPQQTYRYGYGTAQREANQGYLFVDLKDDASSPANISGKVRLVQEDANGLNKKVVFEEQADVLNGSESDRTQKIPLPEQINFPQVGEDSYMKVEFYPVASSPGSLSYSNSTIYVPTTVRQ